MPSSLPSDARSSRWLSASSTSAQSNRLTAISVRELVLFAVAVLIVGVVLSRRDVTATDFHAFYESSRAWRTGIASSVVFERPNLNPPTLAIVLAPLTFLSPQGAFVAWTALGLITMGAAVRRTLLATRESIWWVLGMTLSMPALTAWQEGQLTWVLAACVTAAWMSGSSMTAGAWLSLAVAIKPPLALLALLLPWRVMVATATGSIFLTGLAVLITGVTPWLEWLALGRQVDWIGWPYNLSLWGLLARVTSGTLTGAGLQALPIWGVVAVLIVLAAGAYRVVTTGDRDRRWLLALLWSLAASPAGWLYYLPIGLGPLMRLPVSGLLMLALIIWCIPLPLLAPLTKFPGAPIVLGSLYVSGLVVAWIAIDGPTRGRRQE